MWATGFTPKAWKISNTILINKNRGDEMKAYRPVGLANTLYKLWTRLITNTLYKYAEANSILSTTHAGFRKQKDHSPAWKRDYGTRRCQNLSQRHLIVDLTSVFNTTDHDRMLWIMYDLGFPNDAIDAVKNLYEDATIQVKRPSGVCTGQIPVERGTIQGDRKKKKNYAGSENHSPY